MAEDNELRRMIFSFRVSELQLLLGYAGRNKTGRKDQLQSRALELLKLRSVPVQMKVRDLYKRFPAVNSASRLAPNSAPSNSPTSSALSPVSIGTSSHQQSPQQQHHHNQQQPQQTLQPPPPPPPQQQQQQQQQQSAMPKSSQSHSQQSHYGSHSMMPLSPVAQSARLAAPLDYSSSKYGLPPPINQSHSHSHLNYPVHPDVRFRKLPFYQILGELLKPASLVPTGTSRVQEGSFCFHFTPQQATSIASSRDVGVNSKIDYAVQAQLRFCLLETSCDQDDNFPPSICVKVNGKVCSLPNPIPTNKPGVEPKRPNRPVNITHLCKLSPSTANTLTISWASEFGRGYVVGVYLVKRLTSSQLLMKLRARGIRNSDHTRALIKEKLSQDNDSEIATTSLRVSLMCPLGKMRMQVPCRANTCTHLQCFDASLYLQMNEKKPSWICPVCDKPAIFESLEIDGLFTEIFKKSPESNDIQFHANGSWSPLTIKTESHVVYSPVHVPSSSVASASSAQAAPKKKISPSSDVIDLTVSSDDEDDVPLGSMAAASRAASISLVPGHNTVSSSTPSPTLSTGGGGNYGSSLSSGNGLGNIPAGVINLNSNSNSSGSSSSGIAMGRPSMSNRLGGYQRQQASPVFRDNSLMDTQLPQYYPPVSSPYPDLTTHTTLFNTYQPFDLYAFLGAQDVDRQFSYSGAGTMQMTPHRSGGTSSPDVISLD